MNYYEKIKILLAIFFCSTALISNAQNTSTLDFDGINDYVRYNDNSTLGRLDGASNYTFEAWIYPHSASNGERILQRFYTFNINLWTLSGGKYRWYVDIRGAGGASNFYNADASIVLNEWNHIAVICDATDGSIKLFHNGIDVTSGSYTNRSLRPSQASDNLYIGQKGTGSNFFDGRIDEVRLKNIAEDPANLHSTTTSAPYTTDANTGALFHFNENSGSVTTNSASGNTARLGSTAVGDSAEPSWSNTTGLPLPIGLESFTAKVREQLIELTWKTAFEINNQGFEIQKSTDKEIWTKIGWEKGFGSAHHYSFIDKQPSIGSNYYRLKQFDWSRAFQYTPIQVVFFSENDPITVYPNPTSNLIHFKGLKNQHEGVVNILNQQGQKVLSTSIKNNSIDVQSLKNGIYYLQIPSAESATVIKFIKS